MATAGFTRAQGAGSFLSDLENAGRAAGPALSRHPAASARGCARSAITRLLLISDGKEPIEDQRQHGP
jgi:hypothetical protein